jgi:hypothetical protein
LGLQVKNKHVKRQRLSENSAGEWSLMQLIEEINLPNGLKLDILDLSREIAADTIKVEIAICSYIDLKKSFFLNRADYQQVKNIIGDKLTYEYKRKRAFVRKEKSDAVREELINTFKNNSLHYLGVANFAEKLAQAKLREIKNNPYKYQNR